jgi:hypothetical protein
MTPSTAPALLGRRGGRLILILLALLIDHFLDSPDKPIKVEFFGFVGLGLGLVGLVGFIRLISIRFVRCLLRGRVGRCNNRCGSNAQCREQHGYSGHSILAFLGAHGR